MKVYGPYKRKDGRLHVVLYSEGSRQTVSYPKFLYECLTGYSLKPDETIDHINGDFTDNRLSNLCVLSRADNARKEWANVPSAFGTYKCKHCNTTFKRRNSQVARLKREGRDGPFCSHKCVGKVHH